jgi:predicted Holliday junction resolvase-like endonuclease
MTDTKVILVVFIFIVMLYIIYNQHMIIRTYRENFTVDEMKNYDKLQKESCNLNTSNLSYVVEWIKDKCGFNNNPINRDNINQNRECRDMVTREIIGTNDKNSYCDNN